MKAKTFTGQGYIYFVYEDYYGIRYDSFNELRRELAVDTPCYIVGYHYSYYYGCSEPIDELRIKRKPTTKQVREFITRCKKIINA